MADSLGQAQHAATLVHVSYAQTPAVTTIGQGRVDAYEPDRLFGGFMSAQIRRGNAESGFAAADLQIDAPFRFAANHHNPLEALTTTAAWDRDQLTLYDSCQGIKAVQLTVAALLGISPSRIRVLTRYVGGAFGSKAMVWPHVTLTALAAQHVRRPVRLALPRGQCSPPAATARSRNSTSSSGQPATAGSPRSATARAPSPPRSMTGPSPPSASPPSCMPAQLRGGAPPGARQRDDPHVHPRVRRGAGVFTLECMMDEPASQLGIDPIELRLRNLTEVDPNTGNPWSSHGLRNVTSGVHSDSAGPGATRGRDLSATGSG